MRSLRPVFYALFLIVSVGPPAPNTAAQENALPPELNQSSSLSEIVDWLAKHALAQARIGLKYSGPESYLHSSDPMDSMELSNSRLSEEVVFSQGFKLVGAGGCHLTLRNDGVKIIDWSTKSYDLSRASLVRFMQGKKGEPRLTPQSATVFIPLDEMSYRKGKAPYRHTKDPEKAKLLGAWRTKFEEKGFFTRRVFEIYVTSAGPGEVHGRMNAETLTFSFDSKEMGERFNAAFRRAVRLCTAE